MPPNDRIYMEKGLLDCTSASVEVPYQWFKLNSIVVPK